jgi:hypothetical protein
VANLRDFRKRLSVLKKQGLIPASTARGTKIDARYADPRYKLKNGKTLGSLVKKYDDVATGKATALKVSKKQVTLFKKAGYETAAGKVIVPHSATEKALVERGEVVIKSRSGIERIQIPIPFQNLTQYLNDIQKDKARINRMKRRNEYFGFKFFGNNSSSLYQDIGHAIEDLARYSAVVAATSRIKQQEIYRNLEIVRVARSANWVFPSERRRMMSKKFNRERMRKFRKKLKHKPEAIQQQYRESNARRMREYRKRMRNGRLKAYKLKARKRAKKSRKNAPKKK